MKKVATILLVLLILASCFTLASCNFSRPLCKDGCEFPFDENGNRERFCENYGNPWCAVFGYHSIEYESTGICSWCGIKYCQAEGAHTYDGTGKCTGCGVKICKEEGHKFDENTGKCLFCDKTTCKLGDHNFDKTTGNCTYCGKSSCKTGKHNYNYNDVCTWCEKTICQAEGHDYYEGYCKNCDKVSAFAWVYDIFDKPIESPDQGGQGGNNEWNSKCPSAADGSHGWRDYKCIYCGAVLPDAESRSFWDKVGEGAMLVGFMIAITIGASLIYWLGAAINLSFITWIAHGLMLLMTVGIFLMYHWIWGVVFFVVFGGLYLLACSLISQRYFTHNSNFY
ncbi:MAG: hypothetical protein IJX23_01480 [Clostridia bacterium]|nr:hypothetical protein [Clostridia bacterium]